MSLVGPSGSGKTRLIFDMLKVGTFQPAFDKILYFYHFDQPIFRVMQKEVGNIEFINSLDFQLIDNLPNDGTSYLLIFDDSCDELGRCKEFEKIATAGRHKKLSCIFVKHNLFHKSSIGRDAELQVTHIVLFKSPRDVQQIKVLGRQLGLGDQLAKWYQHATDIPYGHLMIDISPRTPDQLRYCTNSTAFPSIFFLHNSRARVTVIDDKPTKLLYSAALSILPASFPENFPP